MSEELKDDLAVLTSAHDQTQAMIDSMRKKFIVGRLMKRELDQAQATLDEGRIRVQAMKFLAKVLEL